MKEMFVSMMKSWFFDNPAEEERKRRLREEAKRDMVSHYETKKQAFERANPLIGIGERSISGGGNGNGGILKANYYGDKPLVKMGSQKQDDLKEERTPDQLQKPIDQPPVAVADKWYPEDDRFFLRRLRAALERSDILDDLERRKFKTQSHRRPYDYDEEEPEERYQSLAQQKYEPDVSRGDMYGQKHQYQITQQQQQLKPEQPRKLSISREPADQRDATRMKQQAYLRDLEEQIRLKKEREIEEKRHREEEDRMKEQEMRNYNPYTQPIDQKHKSKELSLPPINQQAITMTQPTVQPWQAQQQFPYVSYQPPPAIASALPPMMPMYPFQQLQLPTAAVQPYQYQPATIPSQPALPSPSVSSPGSEEKTFLRGVVDIDKLPEWKREEILQKQRQMQTNQELLRKQIMDREREKKLMEEKRREEERIEMERIEKEQRELEEKYQREKANELDIKSANSKSKNPGAARKQSVNDTSGSETKPAAHSGKSAQDIATEKYLEAQREAEELRKNKFKAKRLQAASHEDMRKSIENVRSDSPPIPTLAGKTSSRPPSRQVAPQKRRESERRDSKASVNDTKTKKMLDQLKSLKQDLEQERTAIETEMLDLKKTIRTKPKDDFIIEQELSPATSVGPSKKLISSSKLIPLTANDIPDTDSVNETRRGTAASLEVDVIERLNQARVRRLQIE